MFLKGMAYSIEVKISALRLSSNYIVLESLQKIAERLHKKLCSIKGKDEQTPILVLVSVQIPSIWSSTRTLPFSQILQLIPVRRAKRSFARSPQQQMLLIIYLYVFAC